MITPDFFTGKLEAVDLNQVIGKAIDENESLISDLNGSQLNEGLDSKGGDLGEYKDFSYKNRFRPVDLRLTGEFRRSIYPKNEGDVFVMDATDWKAESLVERYGDDILGLNDENIQKAGEIIKEDLQIMFAEEVQR